MTTDYNIFIDKTSRYYVSKGIYFCSSLNSSYADEVSGVKYINYNTI